MEGAAASHRAARTAGPSISAGAHAQAHVELMTTQKDFLEKVSGQSQGPRIVKPVQSRFVKAAVRAAGQAGARRCAKRSAQEPPVLESAAARRTSQRGHSRVMLEGYVYKQTRFAAADCARTCL